MIRIRVYAGNNPWQVVGSTDPRRALLLTDVVFVALGRPQLSPPAGLRAYFEGVEEPAARWATESSREGLRELRLLKRGAVWRWVLRGERRTVRRARVVWCAHDGSAWVHPDDVSY